MTMDRHNQMPGMTVCAGWDMVCMDMDGSVRLSSTDRPTVHRDRTRSVRITAWPVLKAAARFAPTGPALARA
jgi:hypothetical protein